LLLYTLDTMTSYYQRYKGTVVKTAGVVGGLYVARKYLRDRLEEVKDNMELERAAKERYVSSFSVDELRHGMHVVLLRSAPSSSFRHILNVLLIEITLCLRTFSFRPDL